MFKKAPKVKKKEKQPYCGLALELWSAISSDSSLDKKDLKAFILTCRFLRGAGRPALLREVKLTPSTDGTCDSIHRFMDHILDRFTMENPNPWTRTLSIDLSGFHREESRGFISKLYNVVRICPGLTRFIFLHTTVIVDQYVYRLLSAAVESGARIEDLHLTQADAHYSLVNHCFRHLKVVAFDGCSPLDLTVADVRRMSQLANANIDRPGLSVLWTWASSEDALHPMPDTLVLFPCFLPTEAMSMAAEISDIIYLLKVRCDLSYFSVIHLVGTSLEQFHHLDIMTTLSPYFSEVEEIHLHLMPPDSAPPTKVVIEMASPCRKYTDHTAPALDRRLVVNTFSAIPDLKRLYWIPGKNGMRAYCTPGQLPYITPASNTPGSPSKLLLYNDPHASPSPQKYTRTRLLSPHSSPAVSDEELSSPSTVMGM